MSLSFEQIEPHLHKWAYFFENKRFEHWELINSAWLYGGVRFLPQSKIKFASNRIKRDMIDYMRKESKNRVLKKRIEKSKPFPYIRNFTAFIGGNGEGNNEPFFIGGLNNDSVSIEQKDFIDFIVNAFFMTRLEKLILKLYYVEGFSQKAIGKVIGLSETRILQIRTNLIERLKAVDYSKAI